jgi:hypothetical protein
MPQITLNVEVELEVTFDYETIEPDKSTGESFGLTTYRINSIKDIDSVIVETKSGRPWANTVVKGKLLERINNLCEDQILEAGEE